jgi:hypothetical protein
MLFQGMHVLYYYFWRGGAHFSRVQFSCAHGFGKSVDGFTYDPKGEYIGLNVYDMTPRGGIYGAKCTCNV